MTLQNLKDLYRAIVRLALVSGLVVLRWFQFSRAYMHFDGGTMIVHWHPSGRPDGRGAHREVES